MGFRNSRTIETSKEHAPLDIPRTRAVLLRNNSGNTALTKKINVYDASKRKQRVMRDARGQECSGQMVRRNEWNFLE